MAGVSFRAAGAYLVPGWGRTAVPVSPSSSISWAGDVLLSVKLSRQQNHRGRVPTGLSLHSSSFSSSLEAPVSCGQPRRAAGSRHPVV